MVLHEIQECFEKLEFHELFKSLYIKVSSTIVSSLTYSAVLADRMVCWANDADLVSGLFEVWK